MGKEGCHVEVFSRVTGFFRPVQSWNKGKTAEFAERQRFDDSVSAGSACACGEQFATREAH